MIPQFLEGVMRRKGEVRRKKEEDLTRSTRMHTKVS
jgi:hypothetical protein